MTTTPPPPPSVPSGWYPQGDLQRYWDGARWTEHTAPLTPASAPTPPAKAMPYGGPLMQFASHVAGKNAKVTIYPDRVEWLKTGVMVGKKGTEMVPMRAISSVTTKRNGLVNTVVHIATASGVIEMRVSHSMAEQVRRCLMDQMLR